MVRRNFQTVACRQVRTVRKRRTEGNAMAAQWAFGWEAVHRTTGEQSQSQVGPTILFDRPA